LFGRPRLDVGQQFIIPAVALHRIADHAADPAAPGSAQGLAHLDHPSLDLVANATRALEGSLKGA